MVQKLEELHESGAAPYSDVSCAVVSLASTSLTWSDQTVPQLLAHTYMYTTDFITMHAASLGPRPKPTPAQIAFSITHGERRVW